ncbi:hypothetical protein BN159_0325 [Streptomyces davaonensis JCM 4913]|uniref:Uncharacterized protein n=1 Tax=Streptomyces davaonensis (strain DSM 101723 / JCM 4913 / KCC S-0913 / 768) TaxID=1214101 RepID=K4QWD8_STRDJ|nr:hypothetical protein BN159_0325 [Streptomyces davaonensis JCM 4913]
MHELSTQMAQFMATGRCPHCSARITPSHVNFPKNALFDGATQLLRPLAARRIAPAGAPIALSIEQGRASFALPKLRQVLVGSFSGGDGQPRIGFAPLPRQQEPCRALSSSSPFRTRARPCGGCATKPDRGGRRTPWQRARARAPFGLRAPRPPLSAEDERLLPCPASRALCGRARYGLPRVGSDVPGEVYRWTATESGPSSKWSAPTGPGTCYYGAGTKRQSWLAPFQQSPWITSAPWALLAYATSRHLPLWRARIW